MASFKNYIILIGFLIISTSCQKGEEFPKVDINAPEGIKETVVFEYLIHDVEGIVFNIMFDLHERDRGVINTHATFNVFDGRGTCAEQILNQTDNILLLSFGSLCEDQFGRIRSGMLKITYSDPENLSGNIIEVEATAYKVNGLEINGMLIIENTSTSNSENNRRYNLSFSEFEITISDEKAEVSGTRNIEYEKINGAYFEDTELYYFTQNSLNITLESGETINISPSAPHLQTLDCWLEGIFLPKNGIDLISIQDKEYLLDYGNAGCDFSFDVVNSDKNKNTYNLNGIL